MRNTTMTAKEAAKVATIRFERREDVRLAESLDRRTTLSIGWRPNGPRRGMRPVYAVRLGIDLEDNGIAKGGCCQFDEPAAALACFEKYAGGVTP